MARKAPAKPLPPLPTPEAMQFVKLAERERDMRIREWMQDKADNQTRLEPCDDGRAQCSAEHVLA